MSSATDTSDTNPFTNFNLDEFTTNLADIAIEVGLRICWALLVYIIGRILIWILKKILTTALRKKENHAQVTKLIVKLVIAFCHVLLWLIIIDILGIDIGGFATILAAVVFALTFALAGMLQQIVAGLVILNTKRFVAGDVLDHPSSGTAGVVRETEMFDSVIITFDNRLVRVPNYDLLTSAIFLPVREEKRRVDFSFGISYQADIKRAKKIIRHVMDKQHKFLADPPYTVAVNGHGDNAITIVARGWCRTKHYWDLFFGVMEGVKYAFDKHGIGIPFPQRDVHIYNEEKQEVVGTESDLDLSDISDYSSSDSESSSSESNKAKRVVNRVRRRSSKKGKGKDGKGGKGKGGKKEEKEMQEIKPAKK